MGAGRGQTILAIDFGTSNSLMAAANAASVLPAVNIDDEAPDQTVLRSVFFAPETGPWSFGNAAINQYQTQFAEGRLFRSIKKYLPDSSFKGTLLKNRIVGLNELIGIFLRHLRQKANEHFNEDITGVVLGRPALFSQNSDDDRLAQSRLEAAAQFAGFKHIEFLAEPVAAAYEFRHQLTEKQNVLVADFGGGTSDFTVLRMGKEELEPKDVLAIGGVSIAGDAFDGSIMRHMIAPYFGSNVAYRLPSGSNDMHLPNTLLSKMCSPADMSMLDRQDLKTLLQHVQRWNITPEDGERMQRLFLLIEEHLGYSLFRAIEKSKIELSKEPSSQFEFHHPGIEISEEIFGSDFKFHSQSVVDAIAAAMDETVKKSGLSYKDINVVCCTGGTARIPALRAVLEQRLGADKLREHRHFHSVVGGLAEKAHILARG
jgi:hypothetical chaperone protein